jgi:nitrile hydratase
VPAAASLKNFRRPTGLSAAFANSTQAPPTILAKRLVAVKAGSIIVDVRWSRGVVSAIKVSSVPSDLSLRVKSLESLLVEKGLVDPAALDALIDTMEHKVGPRNGARVVARAWVDPAYKQRLLENAPAAIAELGYTSGQGEHTLVVENGPKVHNLVVCTLCSCYPWPVLGLPPVWYKSAPYRSRAVIDPRGILREFGTQVPEDVEVRVWDSTAELRYLVLPERPAGTDTMTEEQLAALVTRDAMVGVAKVALPAAGGNP